MQPLTARLHYAVERFENGDFFSPDGNCVKCDSEVRQTGLVIKDNMDTCRYDNRCGVVMN